MKVFDRGAVRAHRARASPRFAHHEFLVAEVAGRLAERLDDITRRFPTALDLGCHSGQLGAALTGRGGIETLVQADLCEAMVARAAPPAWFATRSFCPSPRPASIW